MALFSRLKLLLLERRLYHGTFGKYNRYRCWCLKRDARTTEEKLRIAKEVLSGPGVNTMEAQYNELYLRRRHQEQEQGPVIVPPLTIVVTEATEERPKQRRQA